MQIEIKEYFRNENGFGSIRDKLCTDWDVYKSIMYHLLQNAIKFSCVGHKIEIHIELCKFGIELESLDNPAQMQ